MAGRPRGATKDRPFRAALQRRIDATMGDPVWLDKIADALIAQAASGDIQAIREFADRLDGKVPQAIGGTDELDPVRLIVTGVPRADD